MKKLFLAIVILIGIVSMPASADDSVADKAVKARAGVLAAALEMMALDDSSRYPDALAEGICELVKQMKQVEYIIGKLDEDAVAESESGLAKSANFDKLKADFRAAVLLIEGQHYYGSDDLEDALDDLEDEIQDME